MDCLLQLEGASFGYGRRVVVSAVDLRVDPGAFLGLVGPNGAGKTTLFRGVLGLIPTLAGRVERPAEPMGYVPQKDNLDPIYPLRVDEVVRMGGLHRLRGWRRIRPAERRLALECLERVGLADRARAPFADLSGGQRQRVLIARALMVRPRLLLLDEPTSGVDHAAQQRIVAVLRQLHGDGVAILLVSHQIALLRELVESVLWIERGQVRAGGPEELLSRERLERLFEDEVRAERPRARRES